MGFYLNPGNGKFFRALNSEIYVDKSQMIEYTNKVLNTMQQNICVSRPRRFGKSMAADMLTAYYSLGCESAELFSKLKVSKSSGFEKHMNRYNVIALNMQEFLSESDDCQEMIQKVQKFVREEIQEVYSEVKYRDDQSLSMCMQDTYGSNQIPYILVIDEWDCVFREYKNRKEDQERYLDFLRNLLKDKEYIYLSYMTGILPIKKYGTHSALNMFTEFSMTNPRQMAEFVGFTETEVEQLCQRYQMNLDEMKEWYNGYYFDSTGAIYSPKSVVEAISSGVCDTYWNQTETFEALRVYIDMNYDGLKDDVLSMMAGEHVYVNTGSFSNDMTTFTCEDDVLTLLVHLGYLGYDFANKYAFIPNNEVREEFVNAVSASEWGSVSSALKKSSDLLNAIWLKKTHLVETGIAKAHFETSHIQYNDENALSYTVSLALYAARNYYVVHREFPSGKGFADVVYIPKKQFADKPALVVELKWNKSAQGAIHQIEQKEYCESLKEYSGKILLVGINYDKKTREHQCVIKEYERK